MWQDDCDRLLSAEQYGAVIALCDGVLAHAASPIESAHAQRYRGVALWRCGHHWAGEAVAALRQALDDVGRRDPACRARILVDLLAVYATIPDQTVYADLHQEYLHIAERTPAAQAWAWNAWINAGCNAAIAGDLPAAATAFQRAAQLGTPAQAAVADQNYAHVLIALGQAQDATAPLQRACAGLPDAWSPQLSNTRARHALALGDVATAQTYTDQGLAHPSCSQETRAELLLSQALIARQRGAENDARTLAMRALDDAYQGHRVAWEVLHEAHQLLRELGTQGVVTQ